MLVLKHFNSLRKAEHAAMAGLTLTVCGTSLMLMHGQASADTTTPNTTAATTVNDNRQVAQSAAADQQNTSAASQSYQNVPVAVQAYNTQAAPAAVNQTSTNTGTAQASWLDQTNYSSTNLHVQGWHAADQSVSQPNHFLIVYDQTDHKQLAVKNITNQEASRPDVAKAHPEINNAAQSGFDTNFTIDSPDYLNHQLALVSRYSAFAGGNGDDGSGNMTDHWFILPRADQGNEAWLDMTTIGQGKLHVSGWHATKNSLTQTHHYIIIVNGQGRELARKEVTNTARPDVAKAHPDLYNAGQSGFSVDFDLQSNFLNQPLRVISRYSADPAGNNNYTDVWFNTVEFRDNHANDGWLDNFNISNGKDLTVSGWHAADDSIYEPNHFLILYDQTTHQQVAAAAVKTVASDDVYRAHRDVLQSGMARFSYTFSNVHLTPGHSYSIVSRYSSINTGNGDNGRNAKTDYWYKAVTLDNQNHYSIDSWSNNGRTLTVSGWMANSDSINMSHPYAILLNNGKEVTRVALTLTNRPDVAKAYPEVWGSLRSGFTTSFDISQIKEGNFQLILRFSNQDGGEGQYVQAFTGQHNTSEGYFDQTSYDRNSHRLTVSGWHAAVHADGHPYQYIIALVNGTEAHRWRLSGNQINLTRNDIANKYGYADNARTSGFSAVLDAGMLNGHLVTLIHRITDDPNGNGNYIDYRINNLYASLTYNMQANVINRFILNNRIGHAGIQTHYVIPQVTGAYNTATGKPTMVVVHETANPNDSIWGEINYEQTHYNNAFVHAFVDGNNIIEISPTDREAWGCCYPGNGYAVQFEQVEVYGRDNFARELANAAYYAAYNIVKYQMQPHFTTGKDSTLYSHHMVSNFLGGTDHVDPDGYWSNRAGSYFGTRYTMADFDELVKYAIVNWVI